MATHSILHLILSYIQTRTNVEAYQFKLSEMEN
jgi:hypothetical protein